MDDRFARGVKEEIQRKENGHRSRFPQSRGVAVTMSIKAYQYRIYANKHTTEKLQWVLSRCRELYNAGLQERRDAYELGVKRHPNYYDDEACKQLTHEHAVGYYEQKRELVDIKSAQSLT